MGRVIVAVAALLVSIGLQAGGQTGGATNKTPETKPDKSKPDDLSDYFPILTAAEAGGGFTSGAPSGPTAFSGAKIGINLPVGGRYPRLTLRTFTLDLQYDRIQSKNGFSTELSVMLPIFRHPKPLADSSRNYLRIYAEPGAGYRSGSGAFGGYASAKVMLAWLSDDRLNFQRLSPFVEFQRRFPFSAPLRGDNRVTLGVMVALCNQCGLD